MLPVFVPAALKYIPKDSGNCAKVWMCCPKGYHIIGTGLFLKIYCSLIERAWNSSLALALRST